MKKNLTLEIEFIDGKIKEYNEEGKLLYEGDYWDYERDGKGKEFDKNGEIIFEGEFSIGKRWNGKGKEYNDEGEL
jgi:antitoxin component YwqK of YwqJK toxin-antitoxin module